MSKNILLRDGEPWGRDSHEKSFI